MRPSASIVHDGQVSKEDQDPFAPSILCRSIQVLAYRYDNVLTGSKILSLHIYMLAVGPQFSRLITIESRQTCNPVFVPRVVKNPRECSAYTRAFFVLDDLALLIRLHTYATFTY